LADVVRTVLTTLAASGSDANDTPPVPSGVAAVVTVFGGADINLGDGKSSAYLLQWGTVGSFQDVAVVSVSGNTFEQRIDQSFLGDGQKFFRIMRQNNSSFAKRCPVWLKGYY